MVDMDMERGMDMGMVMDMGIVMDMDMDMNIGGFQLEFISISWVYKSHDLFVINQVFSLVENTAFRLESKSCKGFSF